MGNKHPMETICLVQNPPEEPRVGFEFIGTAEVARALGVSPQTVINRVYANTLAPMPCAWRTGPLGRQCALWRRQDVEAEVERRRIAELP